MMQPLNDVFATSMVPDQSAHPHSLIRIHTVRLQALIQVEKLKANSMDPDQTARLRQNQSVYYHLHCCYSVKTDIYKILPKEVVLSVQIEDRQVHLQRNLAL
jgi:hypothetical protein